MAPPNKRKKRLRHQLARLLFSLQSMVSSSLLTSPVKVPVPTLLYRERVGERSRSLVVLLPGKGSRGEDFERRGFVRAARDRCLGADLLAVDLHYGYYLQGTFRERLWKDVVEPAGARGYEQICLLGISMGASGALGLAREHPGSLSNLILVAPFLGPPAVVEEIDRAGGLDRWSPGTPGLASPFEAFFVKNWEWVQGRTSTPEAPPRILLAFGEQDRFAATHRLLARALPPSQVFTVPGRHEWKTWKTLWEKMLDAGVLPCREGEKGDTPGVMAR